MEVGNADSAGAAICPCSRMQVVGQQHPRINGEWFLLAHRDVRFPQSHPHSLITQNRLAAENHNRKKITRPLGVSAAVIGHGLSGW